MVKWLVTLLSNLVATPKANVAQGMVDKDYWDIGQNVKIKVQDGTEMIGMIKDFLFDVIV